MFYVTMTDTFMSNWGRAERLTNKLIFECPTLEEAAAVAENATNRTDQKHIRICATRPKYYRVNKDRDGYACGRYYVQIKDREVYPKWYEKGAF